MQTEPRHAHATVVLEQTLEIRRAPASSRCSTCHEYASASPSSSLRRAAPSDIRLRSASRFCNVCGCARSAMIGKLHAGAQALLPSSAPPSRPHPKPATRRAPRCSRCATRRRATQAPSHARRCLLRHREKCLLQQRNEIGLRPIRGRPQQPRDEIDQQRIAEPDRMLHALKQRFGGQLRVTQQTVGASFQNRRTHDSRIVLVRDPDNAVSARS